MQKIKGAALSETACLSSRSRALNLFHLIVYIDNVETKHFSALKQVMLLIFFQKKFKCQFSG